MIESNTQTQQIKVPYKARPYQLEIHKDTHRFKILVWHRQSGKTTLAITELIKKCITEPGVYLYVAPEKSQAKNIIWKDPTVLFKYLPNEVIRKKNEVELTIYFKKTIKDQPASVFYVEGADNIDRLRGLKPRGIILDEYDQMDPSIWTEVLLPAINQSNGWIIFIGTFKGKANLYNLLTKLKDPETGELTPLWDFTEAKRIDNPNYLADILPYYKNPAFTREQELIARQSMTPGQFNQEYACLPMEGASNVFGSLKDIMDGELQEPNPHHFYSMGIDLAKYQDYTAVSIIDRNTHHLVFQERWQGDWTKTLEKIILLRNRYNKAHVTIDSTGVGDPIAELLNKRGVRCDDFKFSNSKKDQLVTKMGVFFEGKKVHLPSIDMIPNLINELEQFTYELLSSGKVRYSAPPGLHDDEVMSLGLAIWYLKDNPITDTYDVGIPNQGIPNLDPTR